MKQRLTPGELAEEQRLRASTERTENWKRWGPYLSERQWGTVREDYSANGDVWNYFPHDHARSRAYRWGEDGLLGICDRECRLCFSVGLWNEQDPILKERLFGLTGPQGNHGEDVKECYYYLDSSPTHSYMKALYKYPQGRFPYEQLLHENLRRSKTETEFELIETGIFEHNRYFDVTVEYAKASPDDILIRITIANRGPETARLHVLPQLWYRNNWSWGCTHEGCEVKPRMQLSDQGDVQLWHPSLGKGRWYSNPLPGDLRTKILLTENETNSQKLYGAGGSKGYFKDAFHDYLIEGRESAINPRGVGTKAAAHYLITLAPGEERVLESRLVTGEALDSPKVFDEEFERFFQLRKEETDQYYARRISPELNEEERLVERQAYAGLLWTKQFYHYVVRNWLDGDPDQPNPPAERLSGRNSDWPHLFNRDVISVPDKWEYPWFAAWDLAFHMLPFAKIDGDFAKEQLLLFLREWYMHPNGQIPAYEFALGDVNPPVHAWACWRIYKLTGEKGERDLKFLKRAFHKLMLNFTWWVNRKDPRGQNLFSGGFLGLDNIGVFDRSRPLPTGGHLEQADGTAWMAFFCSTMLVMAMELAKHDESYEDIASKFFEHFVAIAEAMNSLGGTGLWHEEDGFYYDVLHTQGTTSPLQIRSMVGLIPLFAAEVLEQKTIDRLPGFKKRMDWFLKHRPDLVDQISYCEERDHTQRLLAIPSRDRLIRVLRYMLDESEFLSPFGIRALSKYHDRNPYVFRAGNEEHRVQYVPGESDSGLFGGNSNWRGPVWFPVNYLLIEALERYHHYFGETLQVECPTGSGRLMNLREVARELSNRLTRLFLPTDTGRPVHAGDPRYARDPHWKNLVLFYEYFHGETGKGLGASHQTGWTALVTRLLDHTAKSRKAALRAEN